MNMSEEAISLIVSAVIALLMNVLVKFIDKSRTPEERKDSVAKTTDQLIETMQKIIDEEQEAKLQARNERDIQRTQRIEVEKELVVLKKDFAELKIKYDEHIKEHHNKGE